MGVANLLKIRVRVEQPTYTQSSVTGGVVTTYATRIANMRAQLMSKTVTNTQEFEKQTTRQQWRLYCEATDVNRQINKKDRIFYNGRRFEVVGVYNATFRDKLMHIDLEEIEI